MRTCAFIILALLLVAVATVRIYGPPRPTALSPAQLAAPFHELPFIGLLFGVALLTFGVFVPINYLPVQAIAQIGINPDLARYLLAILNGAR